MSRTVSRGLHNASRWLMPATVVKEGLRTPLHDPPTHYGGALTIMERFFNCVLEGVATDTHSTTRNETPVMTGVSALSVAIKVITAMGNEREVTSFTARQLANKYLSVIRKLRERQQTMNAVDMTQLSRFLSELIRQGEVVLGHV